MVGVLKKGECFRRCRSANSVAQSEPAASTDSGPQPPADNAVKAVILQRSISESGLELGTGLLLESEVRTGSVLEPEVAPANTETKESTEAPAEAEDTSFPNLPDRVLKTMGLLVNGKKVRDMLSDDDIENRFMSLCLAFKTDQLTLASRMEVLKRQRDQAESNMAAEVTRLKSAIHKLNRVYIDAESIENLTQIQSLVDVLQQATTRVSSSAEMFGAVQQEHRLSLATDVLMTHVENVRRSLEKMNIELEELKQILADNNIMLEENSDLLEESIPRTHRYRSLAGIVTATKKIGSKRRASIAAMPRPLGYSTESLKVRSNSPTFPHEQKSRMANVVNAIRRKTSLSPLSSTSSSVDAREWNEQVQDNMEGIEEVLEVRAVMYSEDKCPTGSAEETLSKNDSKNQYISVENTDSTMAPEVFQSDMERKEEELVIAQTEKLPNTFQTILKAVKRRVTEIQFQITDLYENHRSTILEKLRWTIATVLIGLAVCFLVWVILPSADATSRARRQTLKELLHSYA